MKLRIILQKILLKSVVRSFELGQHRHRGRGGGRSAHSSPPHFSIQSFKHASQGKKWHKKRCEGLAVTHSNIHTHLYTITQTHTYSYIHTNTHTQKPFLMSSNSEFSLPIPLSIHPRFLLSLLKIFICLFGQIITRRDMWPRAFIY